MGWQLGVGVRYHEINPLSACATLNTMMAMVVMMMMVIMTMELMQMMIDGGMNEMKQSLELAGR